VNSPSPIDSPSRAELRKRAHRRRQLQYSRENSPRVSPFASPRGSLKGPFSFSPTGSGGSGKTTPRSSLKYQASTLSKSVGSGGDASPSGVRSDETTVKETAPTVDRGLSLEVDAGKLPPAAPTTTTDIVVLEGLKLGSLMCLFYIVSVCGSWARVMWSKFGLPESRYSLLIYYGTVYFSTMFGTATFTILSKWVIFGTTKPGIYRDSLFKKWARWWMNTLSKFSFSFTLLFDYSRFNTLWLRMMGMKTLWNSLVLNPTGVIPAYDADCMEFDSDSVFISSVKISLDEDLGNGWRKKGQLHMGDESWIGLGSVVQGDVSIERHGSCGALSYVPDGTIVPADHTAFGNPIIFENHKTSTSGSSENINISHQRHFSFIKEIPNILVTFLCIFGTFACVIPAYEFGRWLNSDLELPVEASLALLCVSAVMFMATLAVVALILKWIILGKQKESVHDASNLQSGFFIVYAGVNRVNYYVRIYVLPFIAGTVWAPLYHKLMGGNVSLESLIFTSSVLDHDMISIEDGAVLDEYCYAIAHVLANHQFVTGPMRVGQRAVMQPHSICFNNDHVEDEGTLGVMSKCFPGQSVTSKQVWQGAPALKRKVLERFGSFRRNTKDSFGRVTALQDLRKQSVRNVASIAQRRMTGGGKR